MSGHRQAAAALHGLASDDRQLILDQLPPADQQTLRDYLAELDALGFEGMEPDLLKPTTGAPDVASAKSELIYAILAHEPAALVAQILAIRAWRWADGLLALYPPAKRDAICGVSVRAAPARDRLLLEMLTARLHAGAASVPLPRRHSALAPLLRLVRPWRR
ncbi:hypothetical protein GJ699_29785 [Duganella sp. FT80W]|uniref:Uncharacterized protein n=1 Tax=Duganella guangzhouensis TaxID=2666084 RepID=A0A6I2L8Z9_9BURK|nr:hypothetical protein [Duganella guangzhouensis]MRW94172.1 hypothetical protein [Duganella guangzhouensis]